MINKMAGFFWAWMAVWVAGAWWDNADVMVLSVIMCGIYHVGGIILDNMHKYGSPE